MEHTGMLPDAMCGLLSAYGETTDEVAPPGVYDLDESALDAVLDSRRELLRDFAELATGDLRSGLEEQLTWQAAIDADMLDTWDVDRVELAATRSDVYRSVWGESVRSADGRELQVDVFHRMATAVEERLVVGCRAPELADGPRQETTETPPPGRLVFYRPGEGYVVSDTAGNDERVIPAPEGWETRSGVDVVGNGETLVVSAERDDRFSLLEIDLQGTVRWVISRTDLDLVCGHVDDTGSRVIATDNTASTAERDLILIDDTGQRESGPLTLPFASVGCADFVGGDRLVVADAARSDDGPRGIWTVGIDGSAPRELFRHESWCASSVSDVGPAGRYAAVLQTCADPLLSGLWVVDLESGDRHQIAVGHAGPAKWSPDGSWLVFGFEPIGSTEGWDIWMAKTDGSQLRAVVDGQAATPAWLPPG